MLAPPGTDYALLPNQLTILENFDRDESGQLITRLGTEKLHSTPITPPNGDQTVRSLYEFRKQSGDSYLVCNVGNALYSYNPNTLSWELVGTFQTANETIIYSVLNDTLYMTSPNNRLYSWGGAGSPLNLVSAYPNPGGTAMAAYRNRLYIAYGLTLYFCALGNPNDWSTSNNAGFIPSNTREGTVINALMPFYTQLIVGSDADIGRVLGTSPVTSSSDFFRYEAINQVHGHEAGPYGMVAAGNDVYFMSSRGVSRLFTTQAAPEIGDVREDYASALIEPSWVSLNKRNLRNRFAINVSSRSKIIFAVGEHSPENQVAYVADYYHLDARGRPTWGKYFPFRYASGVEVKKLFDTKTIVLGGYDGFVYKMSESETDDGSPIFCRAQLISDLGQPAWEKNYRFAVFLVESPDVFSADTLTVRAHWDDGSVFTTTPDIVSPASGQYLGINWVMGSSHLGSGPRLALIRASIPGTGRDVHLTFEHTHSRRIKIGGVLLYGSLRRLIA